MTKPLVTIGIPTFERLLSLKRALHSAQCQSYCNLDILVVDNGSTDGTPEALILAASDDARIRLVLREQNLGAVESFNTLVDQAEGEFLLFLADDDCLRPEAVERLMELMLVDDGAVLAGGRVAYEGEGIRFVQESPSLLGPAALRVLKYYRTVSGNGIFYGLGRISALRAAPRLTQSPGSDWIWVASLAAQGRIRRAETVLLTRGIDGVGRDIRGWARRSFGGMRGRFPYVWAAIAAARDIVRHPTFDHLGPARYPLAAACCGCLAVRAMKGIAVVWAWRLAAHLLHPHLRALARRWRRNALQREANLLDQTRAT